MTNHTDERATAADPPRPLTALDAWMAANPWHPRIVPMLVFLLFLPIVAFAGDLHVSLRALAYVVQLALVGALLWRYRRLMPELTLRFHWLAAPVGVALCAAWVGLGHLMIAWSPGWFAPGAQPHALEQMSPAMLALMLTLRVAGMVMLVPLFEEVFVRSACLRGFHSPRKTWIGLMQIATDLPILGDWLMETRYGRRMERYPLMFTWQLREWPVGRLTLFGVCVSTAIFAVNHVIRDWPGAIVCGVAWCALLWWTNERRRRAGAEGLGLGPIVWSHGVTNLCLIVWCIVTEQWFFL